MEADIFVSPLAPTQRHPLCHRHQVLQSTVLSSDPHPVGYHVCHFLYLSLYLSPPSSHWGSPGLFVLMLSSDLSLVTQIPKPSSPCMTRGCHFPSVLPPPCPPYTHVGSSPGRVAPLHLGIFCPPPGKSSTLLALPTICDPPQATPLLPPPPRHTDLPSFLASFSLTIQAGPFDVYHLLAHCLKLLALILTCVCQRPKI